MHILTMFSFFQKQKHPFVGFEDVKITLKNKYILLNVLPNNMQNILIKDTLPIDSEEQTINTMINDYNAPDLPVVVYGLNYCDQKTQQKYDQLLRLGVEKVYIYAGGLFEWLLLNELYGSDEFPVENPGSELIDLLKYRPVNSLS